MDTRTPQEIAYDATALSTRTPDPTMGTDVTDEMIAIFERLEAAYPKATPEEILRLVGQPTEPRQYSELIAILEKIEPHLQWEEVRTPLATFPDGSTISGTYEEDGERACVHLQAQDGQFYAAFDGSISGDWADHYFETLTLDQVEKLRDLFNGPLITALVDAAKQWCKE